MIRPLPQRSAAGTQSRLQFQFEFAKAFQFLAHLRNLPFEPPANGRTGLQAAYPQLQQVANLRQSEPERLSASNERECFDILFLILAKTSG